MLQAQSWYERLQWLGCNCKTSVQVGLYMRQLADFDYIAKGIDSQWCTGGRHSQREKPKAV